MTDASGTSVPVFVSYSHDSAAHKQRVAELATRLRREGIDCDLDQWVVSPPEGWPTWMVRRITDAKFVLVICTERYHRRVTGLEEVGGLGSRWEGALVTQELYEAGGANTKFIPVIFESGDHRYRPIFLRGATYYDLSRAGDYDRLYRHLTEQHAAPKPPLGSLRRLLPEPTPETTTAPARLHPMTASARDPSSLVLLLPLEGGFEPLTTSSKRIELSDRLIVELTPDDAASSATINTLRQRRGLPVGVAFGTTPVVGRVEEGTQTFEAGEERWRLVLAPTTEHLQGVFGEMSFSSISADEIAAMRARRILLDERPKPGRGRVVDQLNDATLEALVRGLNAALPVTGSPFPRLFRALSVDIPYFLAAARLFGILLLYISSTVDRIHKLDLQIARPQVLSVNFVGQRPRRFSNVEPPILTVRGECDLSAEAPEA
jgi:TIR domain